MNNITIGYLSWKRHEILNQTLESHRINGLFDLIKKENRIIFFQELSNDDIVIANKFNCNYIGDKDNIGILNAFVKLINECKTEYFIFSENDWFLIENKNNCQQILLDCVDLLNNHCDIIRLRHKNKPGNPLYSMPSDINKFKNDSNISQFVYKLESLTWINNPNEVYNNILHEYNGNYKWYITTLKHQRWSNNIFIAKTSYLKNIVIPLISNFKNSDNYGGLEDILGNYNNYIGQNNELDNIIKLFDNTKIAGGEGLFMHKDFI